MMAENVGDDDLIDTLRLSLVPGVGPRIRKALLERFGTARAALAARAERTARSLSASVRSWCGRSPTPIMKSTSRPRSPCAANMASTS